MILDAILVKLDIGAELPQVGPNGEVRPATDKYHERLQQLEKIVEGTSLQVLNFQTLHEVLMSLEIELG